MLAVDIVLSFESPIDPANLEAAIEPPNIAFVIPLALTCNESDDISIEESSTPTASTPLEAAKPSPAIAVTTSAIASFLVLLSSASIIAILSLATATSAADKSLRLIVTVAAPPSSLPLAIVVPPLVAFANVAT